MGNLINPIGGRLGILNYWESNWPIAFNRSNQFMFFQVSVHLRMLIHSFFFKTFSIDGDHFSSHALFGLLLSLNSSIWGFLNKNLNIYLSFFDYKVSVNILENLPSRTYLKSILSAVRNISLSKNWFKCKPSFFDQVLEKNDHFGQFFPQFLMKANDLPFVSVFRKYVQRGFKLRFSLLHKRLYRWHFNLISYTKPYLKFLCQYLKFSKCFFFTTVGRSTITAGMIARFIILKFQQGFSLNYVLNTVRRSIRFLLNTRSGYKICLSGRFTRKQIATYRWVKSGSISLNQNVSGIDYVQDCGISKFGLFGVKLWFFKHFVDENV